MNARHASGSAEQLIQFLGNLLAQARHRQQRAFFAHTVGPQQFLTQLRQYRTAAARLGEIPAMPESPDVATIAVEIGFACLKFGYVQEGRIDTAVRNEAFRAVMAYLDFWREDRELI